MNVASEMIEKAKAAKSPEELAELAKASGMELTEESAKAYFEQLHVKTGELSDDELENVAGGGCYNDNRLVVTVGTQKDCFVCKYCGLTDATCGVEWNTFKGKEHSCKTDTSIFKTINCCNECKYCVYEKGLWLCNNPKNKK